jgi:hypothetical protein
MDFSFEQQQLSERLAQEKIAARQKLLAMPPQEAQELVERTLYPQYWELVTPDFPWSESLPTSYGELDS